MLHADPPDLHPGLGRAPVEADADERVAAQRRPRLGAEARAGDKRAPGEIPEAERDYYLERKYPSFGNLVPRDVASRSAKEQCDQRKGVGATGMAVYLDFRDAIARDGEDAIRARYGNLFQMYERITGENPYRVPMRIYPAVHYTMGGLWVDYNLESTIPGLFVLGEANFSDHGANRLGASALMQGLADGYFVVPATIAAHLAGRKLAPVSTDHAAFGEAESAATRAHREDPLGPGQAHGRQHPPRARPDDVEPVRHGARRAPGSAQALAEDPRAARASSGRTCACPATAQSFNQTLEHAGRVADFLEFAELLALDALEREESCGGHFREEHQTPEGEAQRDDEHFAHVCGLGVPRARRAAPKLHQEPLTFEVVQPSTRSYK